MRVERPFGPRLALQIVLLRVERPIFSSAQLLLRVDFLSSIAVAPINPTAPRGQTARSSLERATRRLAHLTDILSLAPRP